MELISIKYVIPWYILVLRPSSLDSEPLLELQGLRYWDRARLRLPRGIREQCRLRAFARGPELAGDLGCKIKNPVILHGSCCPFYRKT